MQMEFALWYAPHFGARHEGEERAYLCGRPLDLAKDAIFLKPVAS
jgi:hypothetical protein